LSQEVTGGRATTRHLIRAMLRTVPFLPLPELYDLLDEVSKSRTDLERKVRRASDSLQEAAALVAELEVALSERVKKVERLREETERYAELAEIEEGKARALIQQLEATVRKGRGSERVIATVLNVFAGLVVFLLGVWLGPILTGWLVGG
jgi:hypothetical protein